MYSELRDKVVLITGAASGIGAATARAFAQEGTKLVLSDLQEEVGNKLASEIKEMGGDCIYVNCDVSKMSEVEKLINQVIQHFGRLDIAYNNAGVEGELSFLPEGSETNFDRVIQTNVKGVWSCLKFEIPAMKSNGGGVIINCSSIAGVIGSQGLPVYVASKHAVLGLTKNAALENAREGIRVNAVCPAGVDTPMLDRILSSNPDMKSQMNEMHPIGRIAQPKEIASAVLFLASEQASFITGHELMVDGGFTVQ